MHSSTAQSELPDLSSEVIQVRMLRELFARTRESSLVGFFPVVLLGWAHRDAQPIQYVVFWAIAVCFSLSYRFLVAHLYLSQPQLQAQRRRVWFALEWVGAVALATVWVSSITLLGSGAVDTLFYLRLIFLIGLVAFLLSALGIDIRLYASFMAVIVGGTLLLLHLRYPQFVEELPVVNIGLLVYALMLLIRSRGEHRRTLEWVRARLAQRILMDQLNQTIQQELAVHEALRIKSLELEATNRRLGELAIHDGLTGAFRRGYIEGELQRMVKGVQRKPGDFSVMLLDVDFFKRVNDQHGHAVGDEVLRRLAKLVQDTVRENDLFGRWGGEEFVVLMPDTGITAAVEAAERVRKAVHTLQFAGTTGPFGVTISIGVVRLEPNDTADRLMHCADKALYAAKHDGRDRVESYTPALE